MKVTGSGRVLGATVEGLDLARTLSAEELAAVMHALGQYGVLRFPLQKLTAADLKSFSGQLGDLEINVANAYQEPGMPEVMILSNIVEDGKPIGLADAGQDWHTDMSYSRQIAFANVLYGIKIPTRGGKALGATEFCNMHAAYDDLPEKMKQELEGKTVLHDFDKFWENMRRREGSHRAPLTEAQRKAKPPVSHPIFLTHPITGRKVLYANPGYSMRINELPVVGPAGIPAPVVSRLNEAIRAALVKPETKDKLKGLGAITEGGSTPAEFRSWLAKDLERWARVIKAAGVTAE